MIELVSIEWSIGMTHVQRSKINTRGINEYLGWTRHPGPGIQEQASGPGIRDQVSGTRHPGPSIRDQVSGTRHPGPGIRDQASGTRYPRPGIRDQVSDLYSCSTGRQIQNPFFVFLYSRSDDVL